MIEILLAIVLLLLGVLIFLVLRSRKVQPSDLKNVMSSTWTELGLDQKIGTIESHANDIRQSYRSFEQMLRVPQERASFGELALETILSDQLPPDMYGIRETVFDGKRPDAHIKSTEGVICIDSKFSLDNYAGMLATEDPAEKQRLKKDFVADVRRCLDKIAVDYVCPDKGSAEFAFAYIPSESVYYFLLTEAYEMLLEYVKGGVQVVSPLTFSAKIELIRAGVQAKKLSEKAEEVKNDLIIISRRFADIDDKWRVFFGTHLKNAALQAEELDKSYKKLRDEFDRISKIPEK
ncbi:MAG: DNA recombination protein RmuC [Chloroflexi bacterium]|nr:DNA recombination protein RmuC [Chloroflexota bacterium]MBL7062192.1 DNA recombination protein RmuC [Dehalococcoidia bacterium]